MEARCKRLVWIAWRKILFESSCYKNCFKAARFRTLVLYHPSPSWKQNCRCKVNNKIDAIELASVESWNIVNIGTSPILDNSWLDYLVFTTRTNKKSNDLPFHRYWWKNIIRVIVLENKLQEQFAVSKKDFMTNGMKDIAARFNFGTRERPLLLVYWDFVPNGFINTKMTEKARRKSNKKSGWNCSWKR